MIAISTFCGASATVSSATMQPLIPEPGHDFATTPTGLRFHARWADTDGEEPRLDLLFANASRQSRTVRLRLGVTVDSRAPGRPSLVHADHGGESEPAGLDGRTLHLDAGAVGRLRALVPTPRGDSVVIVADVTDQAAPTRLAFSTFIAEEMAPPTSARSRRFRPPVRLARYSSASQVSTTAQLRRLHFNDWEDAAWSLVRESQLTVLYQEAWMRAYKCRRNGHPEAELFHYVHAGVLVLRPRWCGTHEFGEEPGFSVVVAAAVVSAIDTFRAELE